MDMNSRKIAVIHVVLVVFASGYGEGEAQETPTTTTLVPAVITFGDSVVDVGNNVNLNTLFKADKYSSYLVAAFESFIKDLYGLGARRIGVVSLPPLGCLPATRTLFSSHDHNIINGGCVSSINHDAQTFNNKLNSSALFLQKQLLGLKIVVFDIFKPLYDLVQSPSKFGFVEASKGCCGRGSERIRVFLCNPKSSRTCSNATQYVFWDGVHPSEAANKILADSMLLQGISLVT
ncbi:hypothetical protein S245_065546 [Arachis hypogaea]|uniref:GDSL esterase/lipase APG n=1 Tax=Arachis hypogaea TaxID=3818 RepID=A0A444XDH6_ARAHY|nr:GDSL esterase/lipase APG [Arachis hypogaea]RYQ87503.1 hypothetical protein Ahy_B09g095023 [Arachis hypogaea]